MNRKPLAGWLLYDVASSSYVLLIGAVAFPLYFKLHVTGGAPWTDMAWGVLLACSSIVAGLLAPVIGAAADLRGARLRYLAIATVACCASTALLALPSAGIAGIGVIFFVSNVAYLIAANLYDSLLKQVGAGRDASWFSSLGWGIGYIGGLIAYLLCKPFLGSDDAPAPAAVFALSFIIVAAYYALVGGIALLGMSGLQQESSRPHTRHVWRQATKQVAGTLGSWRASGDMSRFILSTNLLSGAANALAVFTPLILLGYFGLEAHQVAALSSLFLLISIPATLAAGWLTFRVSPFRVLGLLIPCWIAYIALLVTGEGWGAGLSIAVLLGLLLGPTNSIVRGVVAKVIEEHNAAEMFGLAAFANRLATALGPLFFGALSSASGNRALPILLAGAVIVLGLALLPRRSLSRSA